MVARQFGFKGIKLCRAGCLQLACDIGIIKSEFVQYYRRSFHTFHGILAFKILLKSMFPSIPPGIEPEKSLIAAFKY